MKQLLGATILPVIAAMALPIWMMKLNYTVDNPWGIGLSKAQKTGLVSFYIKKFFIVYNNYKCMKKKYIFF